MLRKLRALFGGAGGTATTGIEFGEPAAAVGSSKSGLSTDEWVWERADEFPYDHHTDARGDIGKLVRDGEHEKAETLLRWCIDYVEAEAKWERSQGYGFAGVAPTYYRHLAIVYRTDSRHEDEVAILERYLKACAALDERPDEDLVGRLERARALAV